MGERHEADDHDDAEAKLGGAWDALWKVKDTEPFEKDWPETRHSVEQSDTRVRTSALDLLHRPPRQPVGGGRRRLHLEHVEGGEVGRLWDVERKFKDVEALEKDGPKTRDSDQQSNTRG